MAQNGDAPRYFMDISKDGNQRRSISFLIASRRCYQDQQGEGDAEVAAIEPKRLIRQIVRHCSSAPDYLLPDTPLKESIFRTMLAGNNQPMTAQEISRQLSDRWAMTAQSRDISPEVVQRLLDNSPYYSILREPEPREG